MKWTIGMPSYNNFTEVFFTVQSLRMHHDLADCEILVIDNFGDDALESFIAEKGGKQVRYKRCTDRQGVSFAKNRIFEHALGDYVLVIDSHILIKPGALTLLPPGDDMIQGPLMLADTAGYCCAWLPQWRNKIWGIWETPRTELPNDPFEIWAQGAGFFACRRDSWLGFNPAFRGFGGETGYIQEKYRKAGRRVWCYPNMIWMHLFNKSGGKNKIETRKINYPCRMVDRVCNYLAGFIELNLDIEPIRQHFGNDLFNMAKKEIQYAM